MKGVALARDWLLLGAESALSLPKDEIAADLHRGSSNLDRWRALGIRLSEHSVARATDGGMRQRILGDLGLSDKSYWLLMLAVSAEIFPEAAAAASILAEDERIHLLTPLTFARLAVAALDATFADALCEALPTGAARRLGLIETVEVLPGRPTTHQGLRFRGDELAALLNGSLEFAAPRALVVARMPASRGTAYAERMAYGASQLLNSRGFLGLRCESSRAGRQFALDVATMRQCDAQLVSLGDTLPEMTEIGRLRQAAIVVLDLSTWPNERPFPIRFVLNASEVLSFLLVIVSSQASTGWLPTVTVPVLGREEAQRAWASVLEDSEDSAWLARRFRLGVEEATLAVAEARNNAALQGQAQGPARSEIARAVLAQGSRRMGRAVTHLASNVTLDELMVPESLRAKLHELIGWYTATERVERDYGMKSAAARSIGLACLFTGQPGTGKTFAAQCIANQLGLNLYRIDLSQVVSKYIGETEKALAQVFDEAEAGHGVLLFDEADALFGKRTEVKDAHDRYANVEVGYLLQRVESFSGIAILTTNLRNNIDAAFTRRLRFVLEFPVPSREQRRALWERALPASRFRHKDLDLNPFVDRFRLSGGHIHNIGLAATHLAASHAEGLVGTAELVRATYRELEKAGLARSAAEFGPLAEWLPVTEAQ